MKKEIRGTPVKIPYRSAIKEEWFRRFTFRERIKILFGYNLVVHFVAACRHKPGDVMLTTNSQVVPTVTADALMTEATQKLCDELLETNPLAQHMPATGKE